MFLTRWSCTSFFFCCRICCLDCLSSLMASALFSWVSSLLRLFSAFCKASFMAAKLWIWTVDIYTGTLTPNGEAYHAAVNVYRRFTSSFCWLVLHMLLCKSCSCLSKTCISASTWSAHCTTICSSTSLSSASSCVWVSEWVSVCVGAQIHSTDDQHHQ